MTYDFEALFNLRFEICKISSLEGNIGWGRWIFSTLPPIKTDNTFSGPGNPQDMWSADINYDYCIVYELDHLGNALMLQQCIPNHIEANDDGVSHTN
eukprot:9538605-Ditylum_brightwellii.AAC.1